MAYGSEISHYTGEYLAWSPVDLLSVFVVEGLHGDKGVIRIKSNFGAWDLEFGTRLLILVSHPFHLVPHP